MNKAEEFISQEETINTLMMLKGEGGQGEANSRRKMEFWEIGSRSPRRPSKEARNPFYQWEQKLTPLNTSVTKVFMEIKRDLDFRWLARIRAPPQKCNNQNFCDYHNNHGYTIEDCTFL